MKSFIPENRFFRFLVVICFFYLGNGYAQTGNNVTLQWLDPIEIIDSSGRQQKLPYFLGAVYGYSFMPEHKIRINGYVEQFDIIDPQSASLSQEEAKLLGKFDARDYNAIISYARFRGNVISTIRILPLRRSSAGIYEKLLSFSYAVKMGNAPVQHSYMASSRNNTNPSMRLNASGYSSVLASGSWYKYSVTTTGIHKIGYEDLRKAGINPDHIDPRQLKLYGNGGGMLPQANSAGRVDDLIENAIFVFGEGDGKFDKSDYILFYAQGPHTWKQNGSTFQHTYNLYSDKAFYFLTTDGVPGLRVSSKTQPGSAAQTLNTYDAYIFHEKDEYNLLTSGREWLGELFNYVNPSRTFNFALDGLVPSSNIAITLSVAARANITTSFQMQVNNTPVGTLSIPGIENLFSYAYSIKARSGKNTYNVNSGLVPNGDCAIRITYNFNNISSLSGHLDYLEINYKSRLGLYGNQTSFRSLASTSALTCEYVLANAVPDMQIWEVSNPLLPSVINYSLAGNSARFNDYSNDLREYITFAGQDFPAAAFETRISNQNLHGIGSPVPELLIIVADELVSSAERLAAHRRTFSGIKAQVVPVRSIYNEFSSGSPDLTGIRDFIRMVYNRSLGADSLRYVLLFGDCSYDYKDRIPNNTNLIPIYESRESFHPIQTFSSDDYFGFMDSDEGEWPENNTKDHALDLGVGRLPASTREMADQMVDKIIYYDSNPATRERWRTRICFVADDGDKNIHQDTAERLSGVVATRYPFMNISKVYLDAFPQISAPGGEISPEAKRALNGEIEKGLLITNFTGHGSEQGWMQEEVLRINDILGWKNKDKLTFMVTATCEFGRYDDPNKTSGAEYALRSAEGGAIALMTTTRPVLSSSNDEINSAFYEFIFEKVNGAWPAFGDVLLNTKNKAIVGVYNRNYSLLGDPSQQLGYPQEEIVVTAVNGKNPATYADTLNALSRVTIEGEVRINGVRNNSFNGMLQTTIFDKPSQLMTLGNELGAPPILFSRYDNSIFDGKASVRSGEFKFSFVVPKDISYLIDNGKISVYAATGTTIKDAAGYENRIFIGGTSDSVVLDNTPPTMRLYMNDQSFVNGGVTGSSPMLLVHVFDENGINIAGSGIGHELTAVLDESREVIILNEYYTAKLDSYQEGTIEYPLKDLAPGNHIVRVKVWDTHNNSAEDYLEFVVVNDEDVALRNVLNYPNPFSTNTEFHFDHNRAGDDIEVQVQVYTISGKLIKSIRQTIYQSGSHVAELRWDGRDDFGDKLAKGVYVYKLELRSVRDGSKGHKYQKLVILN